MQVATVSAVVVTFSEAYANPVAIKRLLDTYGGALRRMSIWRHTLRPVHLYWSDSDQHALVRVERVLESKSIDCGQSEAAARAGIGLVVQRGEVTDCDMRSARR